MDEEPRLQSLCALVCIHPDLQKLISRYGKGRIGVGCGISHIIGKAVHCLCAWGRSAKRRGRHWILHLYSCVSALGTTRRGKLYLVITGCGNVHYAIVNMLLCCVIHVGLYMFYILFWFFVFFWFVDEEHIDTKFNS